MAEPMNIPDNHRPVVELGVIWRRRDVPQAGISMPQHPDWATFETIHADRGVVYQRFGAAGGMVFTSYGPDATLDWQLAHTGIEALTTRTLEADEAIDFLGSRARRVRLHLRHAPSGAHQRGTVGPEALPEIDSEVMVLVGLTRGGVPVLVGYRVPQSEQAVFEPLLEYVLHGIQAL